MSVEVRSRIPAPHIQKKNQNLQVLGKEDTIFNAILFIFLSDPLVKLKTVFSSVLYSGPCNPNHES